MMPRLFTAITIGLTVCIFTLDLLTPFGYVSWILYLIPLLLALRLPQRAAPLLLAGSCTALIALGFIAATRWSGGHGFI